MTRRNGLKHLRVLNKGVGEGAVQFVDGICPAKKFHNLPVMKPRGLRLADDLRHHVFAVEISREAEKCLVAVVVETTGGK